MEADAGVPVSHIRYGKVRALKVYLEDRSVFSQGCNALVREKGLKRERKRRQLQRGSRNYKRTVLQKG